MRKENPLAGCECNFYRYAVRVLADRMNEGLVVPEQSCRNSGSNSDGVLAELRKRGNRHGTMAFDIARKCRLECGNRLPPYFCFGIDYRGGLWNVGKLNKPVTVRVELDLEGIKHRIGHIGIFPTLMWETLRYSNAGSAPAYHFLRFSRGED